MEKEDLVLSAFANAFRTPDLRRKLLFVLAMIAIFRFGSQVPTPGVNVDSLVAKGAVRDGLPVKVLGQGDLSVKVQVSANAFSNAAKEKIEAAGGTTTLV